jgi:hypothetical protein
MTDFDALVYTTEKALDFLTFLYKQAPDSTLQNFIDKVQITINHIKAHPNTDQLIFPPHIEYILSDANGSVFEWFYKRS